MPRHHHLDQRPPEPPVPPIPPIPPVPPVPLIDCEGGMRFGDIWRQFATGRGWQGSWGPFRFDFGDGPDGGRGGRRGRRARRMFEGGELRLVLLKLIADEPRHGYDLIRAVEEMTGGEYAPSPGVVYPTLTLLQDMGLIEEAPGEGPRKPFQVTDEGRQYLDERAEEIEALLERLEDLKPRHSDAGPAIGRAVIRFLTALSHRVGRDGFNDDLLHEIAGVLDEAAQKIERIK
jgi:DNA-binding PadR family transcriptional regulator